MTKIVSPRYLRMLFFALRANAVFSFSCGLVLATWSEAAATWMGFPDAGWLRLIGLGLVAFGVFLWLFSGRSTISRAGTVVISALDLTWVLVTTSLAFSAPALLNATGVAVVLTVALVVLVFFELQTYALWRTRQRERVVG